MTAHDLPQGMIRAASPGGPHEGYMPGFGNDFETEALPGALPQGMNCPQKCNYGLYGEQLSGTAFTAPGHLNERTWCYRIRPSVKHTHRFTRIDCPSLEVRARCIDPTITSLGQYRWDPVAVPDAPLTWITGMRTMTTAGDVNTQTGMASHIYLVNASMEDEYFFSADGELLVVPQEGRLRFCTELGIIDLAPREIAILPARPRLPGRGAGRPGARLRLRKLRPEVPTPGPRPHRRQLHGQPRATSRPPSPPSKTAKPPRASR